MASASDWATDSSASPERHTPLGVDVLPEEGGRNIEYLGSKIAGFFGAGGSEFAMDYLFGEVLSRQSEALQGFLLRTAILDRLTAPLCLSG